MMLDIPQFSEHIEDDSYINNVPGGNQHNQNGGQNGDGNADGGGCGSTSPALVGPVPWGSYSAPGGDIQGFPLWGSVTHPWGREFEAPLIGCTFHDKNYKNRAGFDSPVYVGTPLHATMGGQAVWAGYTKGGWDRLVVIENGDYQIWMAHLSEISVQLGKIVKPGQVIGLSGGDRTQDEQAGNSSGAHLHYGAKGELGRIHTFGLTRELFRFSSDDSLGLQQVGCSMAVRVGSAVFEEHISIEVVPNEVVPNKNL